LIVADTRRRWSEEEKQAIVAEALRPGVARRYGIKPNLLFRWRKMAQEDAKPSAAPAFLPVSLEAASAKSVDNPADEAKTGDDRIEIELANGRRVRVGPGADLGVLKRILE
jgi:transposase